MGTMYSIDCPDCGYSATYFSGPGMMDYNEEYRKADFLKPIRDGKIKRPRKTKSVYERILSGCHGMDIKEIFERHPASEWSTDTILGRTTPYYCKKCEKIRFRYTKHISWEGQDDYQSYLVPELCSVCKTEMALPEEQTEPIKCPKCNSHNAHIGMSGLWD